MFAPAIQQVMQDFGSTNRALSSLVISIYVLGWALGPLAVAPLSEVQGRLVVYTWSNVLYIALTICCALSPSLEALVLFRFLAGAVGSTPLTIGGGTISDFIPVQKRGLALSLYMFGPILGPSIGPFIGGYVTDALSWRWIFWILAIVVSTSSPPQVSIKPQHVKQDAQVGLPLTLVQNSMHAPLLPKSYSCARHTQRLFSHAGQSICSGRLVT